RRVRWTGRRVRAAAGRRRRSRRAGTGGGACAHFTACGRAILAAGPCRGSAMDEPMPAPELQVLQWFNTPAPLSLAALRGRVVAIEAFQMLCPGCVSHGLPQARRVRQVFAGDDVAVIGLHTVFEHHAAMTPVALQAFL